MPLVAPPDADVRLLSSTLSLWGTQAKLEIEGYRRARSELCLSWDTRRRSMPQRPWRWCSRSRESRALPAAAAGLGQVQQTAGRMAPYSAPHGAYVIDDSYNANPHSVALESRGAGALAENSAGTASPCSAT